MVDSDGHPDVLFVMCDQLNAAVLGCYGGPVDTPNIDRLAAQGTRFENAVCTTPLCSPSRATIATGRYPHSHGITYNVGKGDEGITAADETLGRSFNEAGYDTYHYGKWHLGEKPPRYADTYTLADYEREMAETFAEARERPEEDRMDFYEWTLPVERSTALREAVETVDDGWHEHQLSEFLAKMGRLELPIEATIDARIADRGVERIRSVDPDAPFFLTCSFNWPHDPNVVPSPYYEKYDPDDVDLPDSYDTFEDRFTEDWSRRIVDGLGEPGVREFMRIYYGMVDMVDDQIGRLLEALDERGLRDDTVVCFLADHGDMNGEHGMVWKSTDAFYDGVVRVPFLISVPDRSTPDTVDRPCDLADLFPTLADAAGVATPDGIQGEPLLVADREGTGEDRNGFSERIRTEHPGRREISSTVEGAFMLRNDRWKYVRYADGEEFLYELADDSTETVDVSASNPERCDSFRTDVNDWLTGTAYPGDLP